MQKELKIGEQKPTLILCDNQSALKLVKDHVLHARTKHIEPEHHFIREKGQQGQVEVDMFTQKSKKQIY